MLAYSYIYIFLKVEDNFVQCTTVLHQQQFINYQLD